MDSASARQSCAAGRGSARCSGLGRAGQASAAPPRRSQGRRGNSAPCSRKGAGGLLEITANSSRPAGVATVSARWWPTLIEKGRLGLPPWRCRLAGEKQRRRSRRRQSGRLPSSPVARTALRRALPDIGYNHQIRLVVAPGCEGAGRLYEHLFVLRRCVDGGFASAHQVETTADAGGSPFTSRAGRGAPRFTLSPGMADLLHRALRRIVDLFEARRAVAGVAGQGADSSTCSRLAFALAAASAVISVMRGWFSSTIVVASWPSAPALSSEGRLSTAADPIDDQPGLVDRAARARAAGRSRSIAGPARSTRGRTFCCVFRATRYRAITTAACTTNAIAGQRHRHSDYDVKDVLRHGSEPFPSTTREAPSAGGLVLADGFAVGLAARFHGVRDGSLLAPTASLPLSTHSAADCLIPSLRCFKKSVLSPALFFMSSRVSCPDFGANSIPSPTPRPSQSRNWKARSCPLFPPVPAPSNGRKGRQHEPFSVYSP